MPEFRKIRANGLEETVYIAINRLVLGGLTGSPESVKKHVAELEEIGVRAPKTAPVFFRLSASLVTDAPAIQVLGPTTSGEVEPLLLFLSDGIWLGVGSDHTDREAETIDINLSKQLCSKPVGRDLWLLNEVAGHWEKLVLRSHIVEAGRRVLYQEDSLREILHPDILLGKLPEDLRSLPPGTAFMCGTPPAKGGIRPAARFEMELEDPVLNRTIRHAYDITALPHERF
jgi:hypothetical protein